jgi:hypothetical protein
MRMYALNSMDDSAFQLDIHSPGIILLMVLPGCYPVPGHPGTYNETHISKEGAWSPIPPGLNTPRSQFPISPHTPNLNPTHRENL